ncbi:MAG TPA: glycosyltransferase [Acidimicrobiales bacterium]|nr:glycosyltransferase [Acidimicrobiales bacterium]
MSPSSSSAPRVTVFVPTYNRAHWLRRTIETVLSQTYEDFRLVVSDNASTDDTTEVVRSFSDDRLSYRRHDHNVGLLENHNACLRSVETEYALILPDDDLLHRDHLASAVSVLDAHPSVGFIHTAFDVIGSDGQPLSKGVDWTYGLTADTLETGSEFIRQSMYWSCRVCPSTALMRAAAIHPDLYVQEEFPAIDFGMWLRIALDWDVAFLRRPLADFRVHAASHSASFDEVVGDFYNHSVTTLTGVKDLKQSFLERHGGSLDDLARLRRSVDAGLRRELIQVMRNATVPERNLGATVRTLSQLAEVDRRVLTEVPAWRLVAASALGPRIVEWIKSHRDADTRHGSVPCSPPMPPPPRAAPVTGSIRPLDPAYRADVSRPSPRPGAVPRASTTRLLLTVDARSYGGAEAYVARLLQHLPQSYACTLLATEPVPRQLEDAARARGADLVLVPRVDSKFDLLGQLQLVRALRSTTPQLVHVNMADAANHRYALGAAHLLGRPAVATVHTATALLPGLQGVVLGAAFRRVRRVIAVSSEIATHLHDGLGVPKSRVKTVANGVPAVDMIDRAHRTAAVRVGAMGRLTGQKGFDLLLQAVDELVRMGRTVEVVVAGEGVELARLERLAKGLPVRFMGFVEDTAAFLAAADIFCLPSRWEGLPFALLEGMMSGLPCVATDVGDVQEVLGDAGLTVPANDVASLARALDELVRSPDRRMALGRAAHERVRTRYSLGSMVSSTTAVYEQALAR